MIGGHRFQPHRTMPVFHLGHETPPFTFGFQYTAFGFKVGIQLGYVGPKIIQRPLEVGIRHKQVFDHIVLFYGVACLPGQDNELANHILATQVDARIWFGVPGLLRQFDGFG